MIVILNNKASFRNLDKLVIVSQVFSIFSFLVDVILNLMGLLVVENYEFGWVYFDIMWLKRFYYIANAFYGLPRFIEASFIGLSILVCLHTIAQHLLVGACYFVLDYYAENNLEFCAVIDYQNYIYADIAATISYWYKTTLDTILGLWIVYLFINIKSIYAALKIAETENYMHMRSMDAVLAVRKKFLIFLIGWLAILWITLAGYSINNIFYKQYSNDYESSKNLYNVVDTFLNFLRCFEMPLYFQYLNQMKSLFLMGSGQFPDSNGKFKPKVAVTELSSVQSDPTCSLLRSDVMNTRRC
ncbi:hypothetical protein HDU92_001373 [Lobulomyces angularis]|nr:hypothetical protein HDU92_001373 [Lobulomyces angularis]